MMYFAIIHLRKEDRSAWGSNERWNSKNQSLAKKARSISNSSTC